MAPASTEEHQGLLATLQPGSKTAAGSVTLPVHDLPTNLDYWLKHLDLGNVEFANPGHRSARIESGTAELRQAIQSEGQNWVRDPWIFRLAHSHAATSTSFREKTEPSVHVVFVPQPDGGVSGSAHVDLCAPQNRVCHTSEIIRNRLTFSRTSQLEVQRALLGRFEPSLLQQAPQGYVFKDAFQDYFKSAFGPGAVAGPLAAATMATTVKSALGVWHGPFGEKVFDSTRYRMERRVIQKSVEFWVGAYLHQNPAAAEALGPGYPFMKRLKTSVLNAFFVEGDQKREFAFSRLAASMSVAGFAQTRCENSVQGCAFWARTGEAEAMYLLRSVYREFGRPILLQWKPKMMAKVRGRSPFGKPAGQAGVGGSSAMPANSSAN